MSSGEEISIFTTDNTDTDSRPSLRGRPEYIRAIREIRGMALIFPCYRSEQNHFIARRPGLFEQATGFFNQQIDPVVISCIIMMG